jgi:hypothetical protein
MPAMPSMATMPHTPLPLSWRSLYKGVLAQPLCTPLPLSWRSYIRVSWRSLYVRHCPCPGAASRCAGGPREACGRAVGRDTDTAEHCEQVVKTISSGKKTGGDFLNACVR